MSCLHSPAVRRFPIADHFTTLALMNKQDYAHLHGLEVHLSAQNVDTKATVRRSDSALAAALHFSASPVAL
jgi:hypothetical protein